MVVAPIEREQGNLNEGSEPRPSVILRRVGERLGSNFRPERGVRHLGSSAGVLAHKLQGALCRTSGSKETRTFGIEPSCSSKYGQYHSVGLHSETRRDPLLVPLRTGKRPTALDFPEEYLPAYKIYSGSEKGKGEQAQQEEPGPSHRVDPRLRSVSESLVSLGNSPCGSLRHIPFQKTGGILFGGRKSQSSDGRRLPTRLVSRRRLRFSSVQDPGTSSEEICSFRRNMDDPDSPLLASTRLVHRGGGVDSRFSQIPPKKDGSSQTTTLPEVSSKPPCSRSDCLSTIERLVRARGFFSQSCKRDCESPQSFY
ncbi:uncharacterized protein LOC135220223 [Macrobrachium nipponense]|uniref:uncharacterized protein LOC135220223 n=1 Tax=Macrobrachium nipponense TaxID=159736 RepID=UPI0030C89D03